MNKRMRELQEQIQKKHAEAQGYMAEGEGKDLDKATKAMDEADALQKEFDLEARMEKANKAAAQVAAEQLPEVTEQKACGFKVMAKMTKHQKLTDTEKALVSGTNAENGENYLVPEDVKLEINELRKTYVSAKSIVTIETTDCLTGSVNYEDGEPTGLTEFEDGEDVPTSDEPKFKRKQFAIKFRGKLIPISRILVGAERAGLLGYINRWFLRSAIVSENASIFEKLKSGYNGGTPKAIAGWKALKKSINTDIDPSYKLQGLIATNQSGFAVLDEEEDNNGRPILQPNPANPTEKLFQGLPVHVFPDAQLPNIDATHFPIFYGDTKAGVTFVEYSALEFATSDQYLFGKNQNCIRVIEGYDVMEADTDAYIYGSFTASTKTSA